MLVGGDLRYYRVDTTLDGGMALTIRAIRPDDKEGLVQHFERLSPEAHYWRFFGFRKAFTPDELRYTINPNFLEHAAIVAVVRGSGRKERIVGEAGYTASPDGRYVEFALSVRDNYQRKGIGSLLLLHVARMARHWGVRELRADVLSSNRSALDFLIRRGFEPIGTSAGVYRLSRSWEYGWNQRVAPDDPTTGGKAAWLSEQKTRRDAAGLTT